MPEGLQARPVRAVTFDVGGTLITPWPSVGHVYAEVAARHSLPGLSPELLTRRFREAWRKRKAFSHARSEWAELVDATFSSIAPEPPSRTFFPELYHRFTEPGAWKVYEDVAPVLEDLAAQGIALGVISNWDERLQPLLEGLGLKRHFRTVTVSCEVGATKPSPGIFRAAASSLGLPPAEILHVGDEPLADAAGARSAGFQACLLQRDVGPAEAAEPRVMRSLRELLGLLWAG